MTAPTVLVTGANRGLGLALTRALAAQGAQVIAACRDPAAFADTWPDGVEALPLDLARTGSIEALARRLAGRPIDILVNNAGVRGATGGLDTLAAADFAEVMTVNALAPLLLVRALHANLDAGTRRVVAMISSRAGSLAEGLDPDGDYAYRASKAALNIMTLKLAYDFPDLTCLLLHPGWVQTDMGGPEAEIDPLAAAGRLAGMILTATPADSGSFRAWDGATVAW